MARIIDASDGIVGLTIKIGWGKLTFVCAKGWKSEKVDISEVDRLEPIDEENYRSAGKAAAGAIIGGVLTGGIGLIAGAAIGGRRRKTGSYLVVFKNGSYVAFEEKNKHNLMVLNDFVEKEEIKKRVNQPERK